MKKLIMGMGILAFFAAGCNPKFYSPNTENVPLLTEQGETMVNVSGNGNQVEIQGAYAATSNLGIMLNGGWYIPQDLDNGSGGSGRFAELGLGYTKPIESNWVFETYGLIGFGGMENHFPYTVDEYPLTDGKISANVLRYGVQPAFGFKSPFFSAAISSRLVNLSYSNIDGNLIFEDVDQQQYLGNNRNQLLWEPALTIRGGLEMIKLQLQLGHSLNLSNANFKQDHTYMTIGINLRFDKD